MPQIFHRGLKIFERHVIIFLKPNARGVSMAERTKKSAGQKIKSFIIFLVVLFLILGSALFAYKKLALDYNGRYANDRIVYTKDFGFCMLVTYHPELRSEDSKGYAIVRIPPAALLMPVVTKDFKQKRLEEDPANSEDMKNAYNRKTLFGDSEFFNALANLLGSETKSYDIGKYGKYLILDARDYLETLED